MIFMAPPTHGVNIVSLNATLQCVAPFHTLEVDHKKQTQIECSRTLNPSTQEVDAG